MKYNIKDFDDSVREYKKLLPKRLDSVLVVFNRENKDAFLSLAPLSLAIHDLRGSMHAIGYSDRGPLDALYDVWDAYEASQKQPGKHRELAAFISLVKKKIPHFEGLFKRPLILEAGKSGFNGKSFAFKTSWHVPYRTKELFKTASILWRDVYNIKKTERVGIGFELIAPKAMLGHPLEDYLDSFAITWAMATSCIGKVTLAATSSRNSMMVDAERVADLRATLLGCELEKDIKEDVFIAFSRFSKKLRLHRLKPVDATFAISGKGYPGKHRFGDRIGYPSKNLKTRWKSPSQLLYKLDFYPQTALEERDPQARVAFTETLPIDVFIESNLVDWNDIRRRNQLVKDVLDKCDTVFVRGKPGDTYVTDLMVSLVKPDGTRRWVRRSDTDVREKINQEYLAMTGIRAGCMGNIPGGEAFLTPEAIEGTFVGDVVIAIDQSYPLSPKDPFVVKCKNGSYTIVTAPKDILKKFNEKKNEAWKLLLESERNKSLPPDLIELKKRNFERVGEFAINTNPKAKLCDYLIVNEKIARMMHIALGSGYEPDRATDYHIDIVFDATRQKLDVYGVDSKGREHWILKKGSFIIPLDR